MGQTTAKNR